MRLSLRPRLLLIFVVINFGVVAAEVAVLGKILREQKAAAVGEWIHELAQTLRETLGPKQQRPGELKPHPRNVDDVLDWPRWQWFTDAVILDRHFDHTEDGRIQPRGVGLNPLGRSHRAWDFDEQAVFRAIAQAVEREQVVDGVQGGQASPVYSEEGVWGAVWLQTEAPEGILDLFVRHFLPVFLITSLLLTGVTFFAMRRLVLDPVAQLAAGARKVARGELDARLPEPRRQDEMAELMRGFNAMTEQVKGFNVRLEHEVEVATQKARAAESAAMTQRRLAAIGELAAGIAHEINNPLGGLLNAVEVLDRGQLPEDKRAQYLGLLRTGLERIRRTVGQLLRFTPRSTAVQMVSLAETLEDAVALVRHRAAEAGVQIRVGSGGGERKPEEVAQRLRALPRVRGQQHELGQALLNLLVNALDAVEALPRGEGVIDVDLDREGDELRLAVSDNGPGVGAEELARAPDLFYTTKEVGRGSGLGLSIVHNVVDQHGGRLELSSEPGRGFTARIRLPISGEEEPRR